MGQVIRFFDQPRQGGSLLGSLVLPPIFAVVKRDEVHSGEHIMKLQLTPKLPPPRIWSLEEVAHEIYHHNLRLPQRGRSLEPFFRKTTRWPRVLFWDSYCMLMPY